MKISTKINFDNFHLNYLNQFLVDVIFTAFDYIRNDENFANLGAFQLLGTKICASKFHLILLYSSIRIIDFFFKFKTLQLSMLFILFIFYHIYPLSFV